MLENVADSKVISLLEKSVNEGKRVIIYNIKDDKVLGLLSVRLREDKNLNVEIWCSNVFFRGENGFKVMPESELRHAEELIKLYDFSDNIFLVSDFSQYGSLNNYVNTGLLTDNDLANCLLKMN